MRRNPETKPLLEQAVRHVLSEQAKLFGNVAYDELSDILKELNTLASETARLAAEGLPEKCEVQKLTRAARAIEKKTDDLSERLWLPLLLNVSAIFERVEESFERKEGHACLRENTKAHFHDMRIRLLEQTIGARGLINNNDLGDENERIWLQFLEKELGPMFRVIRGGSIWDHEGNQSGQIDLIVVPADARIMTLSGAEGGRAMVYVDQVISAIMVTSTLSPEKLRSDWSALQKIPAFTEKEKDHAHLKGHTWPLCYIVSSQSDESKRLRDEWSSLCAEGQLRHIPQLVIMLDSGFMYGGRNALAWPHPHTNSFDLEAWQVGMQSGIQAGLGLGWLLIQHQGRLAAIHRGALGCVVRQATQLSNATMTNACPPTHSKRFDTSFQMRPISGVIEWGSHALHIHNRLQLRSAFIQEGNLREEELHNADDGTKPDGFNDWAWFEKHLRWFRYGATRQSGDFLALEEWLNPKSPAAHQSRIVVLNSNTGTELPPDFTKHLSALPENEADWSGVTTYQ